MKIFAVILFVVLFISCNKNTGITLPDYTPEIAVEMYLEDATDLKCLISESLSYSSDTITGMLQTARVIFSDGSQSDTLTPAEIYDYESGRHYNYSSHRIFFGDSTRTYTLRVIDSLNREVTASTTGPRSAVRIDSLGCSRQGDKFSVQLSFTDPAEVDNYYRVIIGKGINNYEASNTDMVFPDNAFRGKSYGLSSKAGYEKGDTVTVRLYSLLKNHFDYLQSVRDAQAATYNPFVQPVRAISNIAGGQGIFTSIRYDEKRIVVR